jgi:DNA-binding transcriptional LysR family regulator
MRRRYEQTNLPIEIIRTLVVIAETGSVNKASAKIGLSQSAISMQMKRLRILVGGAIFEKIGGHVTFTPKGELVVAQARKLLQANDQILSFGGAVSSPRVMRLGIATALGDLFLSCYQFDRDDGQTQFVCDHSSELAKSFENGHLEMACLLNPPDGMGDPLLEWQEDFVWVRGRNFLLRPGNAIPLVGWPGSLADGPVIAALENKGLAYRLVFSSSDHHVRERAVAAGIGVMGLPAPLVSEPLVVAREYYLPPLKSVRIGLFARADGGRAATKMIDAFKRMASPAIEDRRIA